MFRAASCPLRAFVVVVVSISVSSFRSCNGA